VAHAAGGLLAAMCAVSISGCDVSGASRRIKDEIEKDWERIEQSRAVQKVASAADDALRRAAEAAAAGAEKAEELALEGLKATIHDLSAAWQAAAKHITGPYNVPPNCLLAIAVAGGVISEALGLGLAGLGYAILRIEALSLRAVYRSVLADLKGVLQLLARLRKYGAKELSRIESFRVTGIVARACAAFCGILNHLCHGCVATRTSASVLAGGGAPETAAPSGAASAPLAVAPVAPAAPDTLHTLVVAPVSPPASPAAAMAGNTTNTTEGPGPDNAAPAPSRGGTVAVAHPATGGLVRRFQAVAFHEVSTASELVV